VCPCVWAWAWTRLLVLRPHQGRLCCNYNKCTNLWKLYPDPGVGTATLLPTSRFPIPHNSPLWDWKKYKLICQPIGTATLLPTSRFPIPHNSPLWDWKKYKLICQPILSCGTYTKAESIRFYPLQARPIRVRKKKYLKKHNTDLWSVCPCVWAWAWTRLLVLRPHQGRLCCNYNKCTNLWKLYPDPGVGTGSGIPDPD